MKLSRLIGILILLLEGDKVSRKTLAEAFSVSLRTISRDLEAIEQAGVPIYTMPGVGGGILIEASYKLRHGFFTAREITALLMSVGILPNALSDAELSGITAKIRGLLPADKRDMVAQRIAQTLVDPSGFHAPFHVSQDIQTLQTAMDNARAVSFCYTSEKAIERRTVHPYRLIMRGNHWYLQAYCLARQAYRVFKLLSMSDLQVLETTFNPCDIHSLPAPFADFIDTMTARMIPVTLKTHRSIRSRILEHCDMDAIAPLDGEYDLVTFPFITDTLGYALLLSYGTACECLSPQHVRAHLAQLIRDMGALYASGRQRS